MSEWEGLLRIALAAVLGGAIGLEREALRKPAGLRTHMLVTMGSAMFMVVAVLITRDYRGAGGVFFSDPSRIGSTIITGIGFLCGGLIFRGTERVQGLTSAAGLWVCAAIGMAVGSGFYVTAIGGTALGLIVLAVVRLGEYRIDHMLGVDPNAPAAPETDRS